MYGRTKNIKKGKDTLAKTLLSGSLLWSEPDLVKLYARYRLVTHISTRNASLWLSYKLF